MSFPKICLFLWIFYHHVQPPKIHINTINKELKDDSINSNNIISILIT